jgi:hypothetical protein
MKKLVVLMCVVSLASTAFAVADPDPNSVGCYFDTTADTWYQAAPGVYDFYVCVTNPTVDIAGWELHLEVVGTLYGSWVMAGTGPINALTHPDYAVGMGAPHTAAPAVVLLSANGYCTGADIFLTPLATNASDPGYMVIVDASDVTNLVRIFPSSGDYGLAVCSVAGDEPVATSNETWGNVKAMFR